MRITLTSIPLDDPIEAHQFHTEILRFQSGEFQPDTQLAIVLVRDDPDGPALLLEPRGDSFEQDLREKLCVAGLPIIVFGAKDLPS